MDSTLQPKYTKIYVAGPMRGYPGLNFALFHKVTEALRSWGNEVISPAEEDIKLDALDPENPKALRPFAEYMRRDIELLLKVEAVAFLPGWEKSEGARIEYTVARALGLLCFDAITLQELPHDALKWSAPPCAIQSAA